MLMLMMVRAVLGYVFIIMDSLRSFQVYSGFFVKLIIHPAKSNRLLRYDWNVVPFFLCGIPHGNLRNLPAFDGAFPINCLLS